MEVQEVYDSKQNLAFLVAYLIVKRLNSHFSLFSHIGMVVYASCILPSQWKALIGLLYTLPTMHFTLYLNFDSLSPIHW